MDTYDIGKKVVLVARAGQNHQGGCEADASLDVCRVVALALGARGARVVVADADAPSAAECVGELAHGGGRARMVVGDVRERGQASATLARAAEAFGGLDAVVLVGGEDPTQAATSLLEGLATRAGGRLVLASAAPHPRPLVEELTARAAGGVVVTVVSLAEDGELGVGAAVTERVLAACFADPPPTA